MNDGQRKREGGQGGTDELHAFHDRPKQVRKWIICSVVGQLKVLRSHTVMMRVGVERGANCGREDPWAKCGWRSESKFDLNLITAS